MEVLLTGLALCVLLVTLLDSIMSAQEAHCQIYSYNIRDKESKMHVKHYFTCCTNLDDKTCQGYTYQKPSRTEEFCRGDAVQQIGKHWTEMETAFPGNGKFACGGCCGQQMAWQACSMEFIKATWPICMEWVQCFQRECKKYATTDTTDDPICNKKEMNRKIAHIKKLVENRTLSAINTHPMRVPDYKSPRAPATYMNLCTKCQNLDMQTRCSMACCERHCCLPVNMRSGGTHFSEPSAFAGLRPLQIAGIAFGAVLLVAALVGVALLLIRRFVPECKFLRLKHNDTQILVIEGPDDVDSDLESDSA